MNVTNCTLANESVKEYLQHLQDQTNLTLIPAVIMLSIFAVTGLIGNILVLVVYSKKFRHSPTKVFIMTIACFDLVANVCAIPSEVNIMFDSWNFSNAAFCKFKVFIAGFTTVGGALSLIAIAVVRYRKICRPYGWQVTIKQAQVTSVAVAAMTLLIFTPFIIVSGVMTIETPCFNITGYECYVHYPYLYTIWPLLIMVLLILLYVFSSSSLVILYIRIGVTAWRISTNIRHFENESKPDSNVESINTGSPVDTESNRLQCQSQPPSLNREESVTDVQESATGVDCKGRLNSQLCSIKQRKLNDSDNGGQAPISMNTFISIKDTGTTEHSLRTHSETVNIQVTSLEEMTQTVISSKGNIPEKNTHTTCKASQSMNMKATTDNMVCQPINHTNMLITEALDEPDVAGQIQKLQDIYESATNGKYTQNKRATQHFQDCEQEQISENQEKYVTHTNLSMHQITPQREPQSNSLGSNRKNNRNNQLGRMTVMLIIISVIYVLGYIPFLVLTVVRVKYPDHTSSFNMVELSAYHLFYRLYYVNSAVNPIIYSLCSIKFRRACSQLFIFTPRRQL